MYKPTQLEIAEIIDSHQLNKIESSKGKIADFSDMDISGFIFEGLDLGNARFHGASITKCQFINCKMVKANFAYAEGVNVTISGCDLSLSDFTESDISSSAFMNASFIGASLTDSNLTKNSFIDIDFSEANFSSSNFKDSNFKNVDLCDIQGNKINFISLQLGGYSIVYTSDLLQIDKFDMSIEDWKITWAQNAENIECENCKSNLKPLLNIAATVFAIISQFPATPTIEE